MSQKASVSSGTASVASSHSLISTHSVQVNEVAEPARGQKMNVIKYLLTFAITLFVLYTVILWLMVEYIKIVSLVFEN